MNDNEAATRVVLTVMALFITCMIVAIWVFP
jgi:hypothetical protein